MNIESDDQTYTFPLIEGRTEWAKPLTEGSWGLKVTDSRATNKKKVPAVARWNRKLENM